MADKSIKVHDKYRLIAFQLKFEGHTYDQIANHEAMDKKYTAMTLEVYFARGGYWYDDFQVWAKARIEDIEDSVKKMLVANAQAATQTVINIQRGNLQGFSKLSLDAALDILDRSGFAAVKKVEVDTPAEDIAEKTIAAMEKRKAEKIAQAQAG